MSSTASGSGNSSRYLDFDEYVDLKLQQTRSSIKTTDILVALAGVAAMFLSYLLVFVIFDQWVVAGGFSIGVRWLLLSTLLLLTTAWLVWKVGLPYFRNVNRLFAAREIEKADAELKSNLLNLVDLRSSGREVNPAILRALEKNAAVGLQNVDVAQAIDHRPLMRIAYVLLAVVAVFCLYALLSPKKISNSIWRSLLPAANLGVATQTEIVKVDPGDTTVQARETVLFTADIAGDVPQKVWLHYTTADGKFRDEPVELRTDTEGPTRFKGSLPNVIQDLTYVVRAGDASSREYRITVNQPPSATVDRIRYQYPPYMKLDETELAGGVIDSWEGTKVHLTAHTNMPVKSAIIEFIDTPESGPNGEQVDVSVSGDGQQLTASWTLGFRSDGAYSRLYQIQCKTESGAKDPMPIQYAITIRPDLPPEVSILEPVRDVDVPANTVVPLLVDARDPDFQLGPVNLHVRKNGVQVQKEPLSSGQQQRLLAKYDLQLERLKVKPGDTVELWVQAFDNRQPRPNSKTTPELKLKIVVPVSEKDAQNKLSDDQAKRDQTLKETEQEQNQDARPEQQPSTGKPNEDRQRDAKDPQRDQRPMPKQEDNKNGDQDPENGSPRQDGSSGSKPKNQGQPDKANGSNQQQRTQNGAGSERANEQNKPAEQPLDPNGSEDDKALERLIDEVNKQQQKNQPDQKNQTGDKASNEQKTDEDKTGTENMPGEQGAESGTNSQPNNQQPSKTEKTKPETKGTSSSNPKKPSETEPSPKNPGASQQPTPKPDQQNGGDANKQQENPDKTGNNQSDTKKPKTDTGAQSQQAPKDPGAGQQPMPKPEKSNGGDENKQQQNPDKRVNNQSDAKKPETGSQPGSSSSQNANDSTQNPSNENPSKKQGPQNGSGDEKNEKQNGTGNNAADKPEEGAKPDATEKKPQPAAQEKNENGPDGAGKPMPNAGPMPGAEGANEPGGAEAEKPANNAGDPQGDGPTKPSKTPMPKGEGEEKPGQSADGPEERTGSSPDAQRKKADGTETGIAEPDRDPKAQPTANSTNPDLKRDPKQAPEVRQREGKGNESNDPAKEASQNEVKPPKPQSGQPDKMKLEQKPSETQAQPGRNPEQRQGDPNAAKEEQKGEGQKDQRAKPTAGGQSGSTKEDNQGKPGSQSTGQGDATTRPGSQQPNPEKSKQPGATKGESGTGKPTSQQGEKKNGSGSKAEGSDQKSPQQSDPSGSQKSGGEGQGQGKATPQGGQPGGKDGAPGGAEGAPGQGAGSGKAGRNSGTPGAGRSSAQGDGPAEGQPNADRGPAAASDAAPPEGEEANLEYKKHATELVLKRLQDNLERDGDDPELREKLGWTPDQLRKFSDRLSKALQESKAAGDTPESQIRRQQFEEMLKSLDVNKSGTTRSGAQSPQREVNQIESRHSTVPKAYQKASENFSRDVTRQKKVDASQK